jgi:hypothetical protein
MPHLTDAIAPQGPVERVGEHEPSLARWVSGEVCGESIADDLGQGHRAKPRFALWRTKLRDSASGGDELSVNTNLMAQEVDSVDSQSEALPLAKPHTRREDDEGSIAVGDSGSKGFDLTDAERDNFAAVPFRKSDAGTWRRRDYPVADRSLEDG